MARQFGLEVDRLRAFDAGQVLAAERDQFGLQGRPRVAHVARLHHGLDLLAEFLVGDAQHRDVDHFRVRHQQVLGLLRVDVDTSRDDHVGLPIGQVQIAFGIDIAHIAQRGPAPGVLRFGGLVRIVVIHERLAFGKVDGADLASRHLLAELVADLQFADDGLAHRSLVGQPLGRPDHRHAVALGAGVVLPHDGPPPFDHLLLDQNRARCSRVDGDLQ